jgi:hypothetical protein
MIKRIMMGALVCAFATSALAQTSKPAEKKLSKPAIAQAQNDTLNMKCADTTNLILSKPEGVVLKTGQNRWDLYVHDSEACQKIGAHESAPAFVRTKDSRACYIGYTCEDKTDQD